MSPYLANFWNRTHRLAVRSLAEALAEGQRLANERQSYVSIHELVNGHVEHRQTFIPQAQPKSAPAPAPAPPAPKMGPDVTPLLDLFDFMD